MTALTGIVLAGGRSSRMGRDKALLDWQGRPLIEHMIALLRAAGVSEVRVSGNRPDYHGIPDGQPDGGPLIGLLSVAECLPDGDLLVLPIDMPRLSVDLLQQLHTAPAQACVHFAGYALPMRLRLDPASRVTLRELAQQPPRERSLRALQARLHSLALPLAEAQAAALDNCNTPEAWAEALRR